MVITEKLDGTNACIVIEPDHGQDYYSTDLREKVSHFTSASGSYWFATQSRSRFITPVDDNFGFAKWAYQHAEPLIDVLGPGQHYGEWWGFGYPARI